MGGVRGGGELVVRLGGRLVLAKAGGWETKTVGPSGRETTAREEERMKSRQAKDTNNRSLYKSRSS